MKVVWCDRPLKSEELDWSYSEIPTPGPREMLVKIHAFGINRADIYQRKGEYPPPIGTPPILGLEVAGEVVALGPNITEFKIGDRVMSLVNGGGYAEYAVVPQGVTFHIPDHLSMEEAASLPEVMLVAFMTLFDIGKIRTGQKVLLHGGSSGVSSFAIQVCKALGALVATTVRNEEKRHYVQSLGADLIVEYLREDFSFVVASDSRFGKLDLILDFIGGPYVEKNLSLLSRFGKLVLIDCSGGETGSVNLGSLIVGCQSIHGTVLRSRPLEQKIFFADGVKERILPLIISKMVKTSLFKVFSPAQINLAHSMMETSKHMGKLVVKIL